MAHDFKRGLRVKEGDSYRVYRSQEEYDAAQKEDEVNATPDAIELAKENGVDLSTVEGSGKDGRILKSDVQAAIEG